MVLIEPDIKFTRIVPVLLKILAVNPCPVHIMPLKKKKKSTYFNLKTFYFEKNAKHSLSLQPVAVFWLLGVLLLTDQSGSWLRWGWPWQFPKVKQQ